MAQQGVVIQLEERSKAAAAPIAAAKAKRDKVQGFLKARSCVYSTYRLHISSLQLLFILDSAHISSCFIIATDILCASVMGLLEGRKQALFPAAVAFASLMFLVSFCSACKEL